MEEIFENKKKELATIRKKKDKVKKRASKEEWMSVSDILKDRGCYTRISGLQITPAYACDECEYSNSCRTKADVANEEALNTPLSISKEELEKVENPEISPKTVEDKLNQVYRERNILASLCARLAIRLGYKAGVGVDKGGNDPEWSHVIYTEVDNLQISYHIAPSDLEVIHGLPVYNKGWDGTYLGKDITLPKGIVPTPKLKRRDPKWK